MNDKQRLLRLEKEVELLKQIVISLTSSEPAKPVCQCGYEKLNVVTIGTEEIETVCLNPACKFKN